MTIFLYSTLTGAQIYGTEDGDVYVNGGANLARRTALDTPRGVVTQITDEQYRALKKDSAVFRLHVKNGFIRAEERKNDPDVVAQSMAEKDTSAQKTEEELKAERDLLIKAGAQQPGKRGRPAGR